MGKGVTQQTTPAASPPVFVCGRFSLTLDTPRLMGIVNITPDSFSDGGQFVSQAGRVDHASAISHAQKLVADGADILDIGGESTRPGATPVSVSEELDRVMPVLEGIMSLGVPISVDTRRPEVMRQAIALGADILNDVNGFRDPEAFDVAANSSCGLCIMHMQGEPQTMQTHPQYEDVVGEVTQFLNQQLSRFQGRGVSLKRILLDPGIGFGKTFDHNLKLMQEISSLASVHPLLLGVSRKSFLGTITGEKEPSRRVSASVAAALWAASQGVSVLRVHDVRETKSALNVWQAASARGEKPAARIQ